MDQNPQPAPLAQNTKITGRTKAALWCLIGPTGLLIVVFLLFAIVNWVLAASGVGAGPTSDGSSFGETSIVTTILNVVLFLAAATAVVTWLPGIIVGIILLATKKPSAS